MNGKCGVEYKRLNLIEQVLRIIQFVRFKILKIATMIQVFCCFARELTLFKWITHSQNINQSILCGNCVVLQHLLLVFACLLTCLLAHTIIESCTRVMFVWFCECKHSDVQCLRPNIIMTNVSHDFVSTRRSFRSHFILLRLHKNPPTI